MSSEIAIKVENLSKCFEIYSRPHDRIKQLILPRLQRMVDQPPKQYFREFWALKDVSFEVKKGETLGIIGRNGSGKSTLLQMLCGTLNPTSGNIQTHGRISALLELGSGFNPEFTGRENIYMNGAVLGLTRAEIDQRYDDIAAFADIGEFIEQPVKTYSSGMMVRLAFAVSIKVEPDLMIVDEALSVGDMSFQAKCMTALSRILDSGTTVVFVSHDIGAVKSLCKQAVYLEHGQLKAIGSAPEIAEQYVRGMRERMTADVRAFSRVSAAITNIKNQTAEPEPVETNTDIIFKQSDEFDKRIAGYRYGSGGARITYVEMADEFGAAVSEVEFNQLVKIVIYLEAHAEKIISVAFNIFDDKKINLTGCGFPQAGQKFLVTTPGEIYSIEYTLRLPLKEGAYSIRAQIIGQQNSIAAKDFLDVVDDAVIFRVSRWEKAIIWSKLHLFPSLKINFAKKIAK